MIKRLLAFILIILFGFQINAFSQERDPILAKIKILKKSYLSGNIKKSLTVLSEIEEILKKRSLKREEKPSGLMPLMDVLEHELFLARYRWELLLMGIGSAKKSDDVLNDLSSWLQHKPEEEKKGQIAEYELVLKYQNDLRKLFSPFGLIGSNRGLFLYGNKEIPIRFADINGKICLLITRVAIDKVYNTLRTTSKSRAAKVLTSSILPTLNKFYDSFKNTDVAYYSMIISYGSKNFLDESIAKLKAEALCLVVSKDNCRKFVSGKITENNLLDRSLIFIIDRDMRTGFKRVKIKIE